MSPEHFDIHSAQLSDAWLSHVEITENPAYDSTQGLSYAVDFHTRVETDTPNGRPLGHLDVVVLWLDDEQDMAEGPFQLNISVTGEFVLDEPALTNPEAVERWIDLNATHLLWSYARSYVSVLTSFSRHPPLTLFTISVPHPRALDPETGEMPSLDPSQ